MSIEIISRASRYADQIAVIDPSGEYTYSQILDLATSISEKLLSNKSDLNEECILFMVSPGHKYIATQWGIWMSGGIAVPIALSHPVEEINHIVDDTFTKNIIFDPEFSKILNKIKNQNDIQFINTNQIDTCTLNKKRPQIDESRKAMIIYTSGTTNKPKGVVTTHLNIKAQITTLVKSWQWTSSDHILNVLPLHHVHGIVNAMLCSLWSGATCEFLPDFDPAKIWNKLSNNKTTLFMAVPTMYEKLISFWEDLPSKNQKIITNHISNLRLMVSGSDALLPITLKKWKLITNHTLLERYGMTEIGMALSNPLIGPRIPGFVGIPLPGVHVRICSIDFDSKENPVSLDVEVPPGNEGELQIKGKNVFLEYWNNPEETSRSFSKDGWFRTGDISSIENGIYKILGRASQDIIKTGGEKVSANEIQYVLRTHPEIKECAVVGIKDNKWGEAVSAALVLEKESTLNRTKLRNWAKTKLINYKVPQKILIVESLPRNAMGKIIKPKIKEMFSKKFN
ncbi:MAG: long-chain fatty acid--CoA ligase [Chloroflexi bacterium]|nr:long-chain fatty acid--CoA ligase [Chloroflexota bacterium]